ncbi:MAG: hypothetical protein ACO4AI_05725 [Prochlorothrix sp.]|nr:hypothetical protein [Prochlorothrix sp.]
MPLTCSRCQRPLQPQATTCPHCGLVLSAYGHPGLTIQRSEDGTPLCDSCVYHWDDSCTFPNRPTALDCTLYRDRSQPEPEPLVLGQSRSPLTRVRYWIQDHRAFVIIGTIFLIALLLRLL